MAADFISTAGLASPGCTSPQNKVAVSTACGCCEGDSFSDPCTLCSSRKRNRCGRPFLPSKKLVVFSSAGDRRQVSVDHSQVRKAASFTGCFLPTSSPDTARTVESRLAQFPISDQRAKFTTDSSGCVPNSAFVPKQLFFSQQTAASTGINCRGYNVSPASNKGTSGQSFTPPYKDAANVIGQSNVASPLSGGSSQYLPIMAQGDKKISPRIVLVSGDGVNVTTEESLMRICFSCQSCGDSSQFCIST